MPMVRPKRRDKDGYSTFSGDSGNVHDFQDGSEHRLSMVKSKSMPEYGDERFARSSASRRSASKKTLTDLTDSGVSVVSDTPPVVPTIVPAMAKDTRVLAWLMEADRTTKGQQSGTHSELSSGKHRLVYFRCPDLSSFLFKLAKNMKLIAVNGDNSCFAIFGR